MSIERMQTLLTGIAARLSSPVVLDDERQAPDRVHRPRRHRGRRQGRVHPRPPSDAGGSDLVRAVGHPRGDGPVRTPADAARQIAPRWVVPLRHEDLLLGFVSVLHRGRLTREQLEPATEPTAAIAETLYVSRRAEPPRLGLAPAARAASRTGHRRLARLRGRLPPHVDPSRWSRSTPVCRIRTLMAVPEVLAAVRHACPSFPGEDRPLRRGRTNGRCVGAPTLRRRCHARHSSGRNGHWSNRRCRPRHRRRHQFRHVDGERRGQRLQRIHPRLAHRLWPILRRQRSVPGITQERFGR